jgi:D-glycero-alpha-D-manno-heptose-7-phosphate kinase
LDFGGGWTDVPPYSEEMGGAVCNVAIARYATATVSDRQMGTMRSAGPSTGNDALIAAALRRARVPGGSAQLMSDFPVGAGLGGSSAAGVALAGGLAALAGEVIDRGALAARSRATELEELGIAGGFQDHYAAAYGGALLLIFNGSDVGVERLPIQPEGCRELARRGVLLYTGESRVSGATVAAVLDAYRERVPRVCDALARMKVLARAMAAALRGADFDTLGRLVGEHWVQQRALHPSISTERIDTIMHTAQRAGALGGKALGASGGGCVLLIAEDGREEELAEALAPLGERVIWAVDTLGFEIVAMLDEQHERSGEEIA